MSNVRTQKEMPPNSLVPVYAILTLPILGALLVILLWRLSMVSRGLDDFGVAVEVVFGGFGWFWGFGTVWGFFLFG